MRKKTLVWMWKKGTISLLVGAQIGESTLEITEEIPQKSRNILPIYISFVKEPPLKMLYFTIVMPAHRCLCVLCS